MNKQKHEVAKFTSIGKPKPRIEGNSKVTGEAVYAADKMIPGTIWGKVLRSSYTHARILRIDTSQARSHPGVLSVITAKDVSGVLTGRRLKDMPILARDVVRFVGERIAVVAAEDPGVAEEAANLIVVEYEELPAVFDPLTAVGESAPLLHQNIVTYKGLPESVAEHKNVHSYQEWSIGDVKQGFLDSDHIFENTFRTQYVHQGYLETHASLVAIKEDGQVEVWLTNKVPYEVREQFSETIGVAPEKIVVHLLPIGGDFGGKGSQMDLPLCYYLARHTGRPVKMVMTYAEELMAGTPRHPSVISMKTGVNNDGTLVARQVRVYWNGGAYGAMKPIPSVNLPGALRAAGCYRIPNVKIDSYAVYTNCVPCGHFRSPGHVQLAFAGESQMDIIAEALGMDPLELRLRNGLKDGDLMPDHTSMAHVKCREVLEAVKRESSWDKSKKMPYVGRGVAISHRPVGIGDANARLSVRPDGTLILLTTYTDTGTGSHTIFCQIVAEALGVPFEQVKLEVGSTNSFRFESGTGGSRVTHVMGQAAFQAATQMKAVLQKQAAEMFHCSLEEVSLEAGRLIHLGSLEKALSLGQVAEAGAAEGRTLEVQSYFKATEIPAEGVFSALVAEVEVDVETGQVHLLKLTTVHDAGTILNPLGHQGQIEGGIVQGLGFALEEEMNMEEGRIVTLNLGEYKIPNIKDTSKLKTVLVNNPIGPAPFQAKEIGESSICQVAPAIANAVYDAVGVRIMDLPITAEKIYNELQVRKANANPRS